MPATPGRPPEPARPAPATTSSPSWWAACCSGPPSGSQPDLCDPTTPVRPLQAQPVARQPPVAAAAVPFRPPRSSSDASSARSSIRSSVSSTSEPDLKRPNDPPADAALPGRDAFGASAPAFPDAAAGPAPLDGSVGLGGGAPMDALGGGGGAMPLEAMPPPPPAGLLPGEGMGYGAAPMAGMAPQMPMCGQVPMMGGPMLNGGAMMPQMPVGAYGGVGGMMGGYGGMTPRVGGGYGQGYNALPRQAVMMPGVGYANRQAFVQQRPFPNRARYRLVDRADRARCICSTAATSLPACSAASEFVGRPVAPAQRVRGSCPRPSQVVQEQGQGDDQVGSVHEGRRTASSSPFGPAAASATRRCSPSHAAAASPSSRLCSASSSAASRGARGCPGSTRARASGDAADASDRASASERHRSRREQSSRSRATTCLRGPASGCRTRAARARSCSRGSSAAHAGRASWATRLL